MVGRHHQHLRQPNKFTGPQAREGVATHTEEGDIQLALDKRAGQPGRPVPGGRPQTQVDLRMRRVEAAQQAREVDAADPAEGADHKRSAQLRAHLVHRVPGRLRRVERGPGPGSSASPASVSTTRCALRSKSTAPSSRSSAEIAAERPTARRAPAPPPG